MLLSCLRNTPDINESRPADCKYTAKNAEMEEKRPTHSQK
jgi:hypothetical protein